MSPKKPQILTETDTRKQRGKVDRSVMFPVAPPKVQLPAEYADWLNDLKHRIQTERLRVVIASNVAMVLLYWDIGNRILEQGWGTKVIDRLSFDLREQFPEMKGFSPRNLGYMKAFAAAWPNPEILQRSVAKLSWRHNITLLQKIKSPEERLWYAAQACEHGWSYRPSAPELAP